MRRYKSITSRSTSDKNAVDTAAISVFAEPRNNYITAGKTVERRNNVTVENGFAGKSFPRGEPVQCLARKLSFKQITTAAARSINLIRVRLTVDVHTYIYIYIFNADRIESGKVV